MHAPFSVSFWFLRSVVLISKSHNKDLCPEKVLPYFCIATFSSYTWFFLTVRVTKNHWLLLPTILGWLHNYLVFAVHTLALCPRESGSCMTFLRDTFDFFKDLFRRIPWDTSLEDKEAQENRSIFKYHFLQAQDKCSPISRKSSKGNSRSAWMSREFLERDFWDSKKEQGPVGGL